MKKYLLKFLLTFFLALFISVGWVNGQTPILTAIVDGDCLGGNPKVLEIYAHGTVDFSLYSLQNQTNANTTWGSPVNLASLGTVADDFAYVYYDSSTEEVFLTEFPSAVGKAAIENAVMNLNGDDRIQIILDATSDVIDQFGVSGVDGTGTSWETLDSYAKRKDGTGPDGGFSEANWTFGGVAALDLGGLCQSSTMFQTMMGGIATFTAPIPDIDPPVATFTEDGSSSVIPYQNLTITMDEAILKTDGNEVTDGDLSTLVVLQTNPGGVDVPFSATIDGTKKIITIDPTSDLVAGGYDISLNPVEDASGNESVLQTGGFTVSDTYVDLTDPIGGEKYYAGDTVWVSWNHANVTTVDVLAYVPEIDSWELMANDSVCDGSLYFVIPAEAGYSTGYKLAIQDISNPTTIADTSATFTVISTPTINDIQSDNTAGLSNYDGDIVRTSGIITFSGTGEYVIQDGDGSWNGIYVYDYGFDLTSVEGDNVTIEAKVANYNDVTQLANVVSLVVNSSGNALPAITTVTTAGLTEEYEGVLVQIVDAEVSDITNIGDGYFEINDGSGALIVDDNLYYNSEAGVIIGRDLTITGIGHQNTVLQLLPRSASDIVSATDTVGSTVYAIDQGGLTITDMPYSTTLAAFEANITPADSASFDTYLADGVTAATVDLQTGYKVIVTAADGITKATYVITKNAALTDATVTSSVYDVDNGLETITNIPYGETLGTFISNITAPTYGNFVVYKADGTTPASDLATGYKLIATAEDGSTTKTYTITVSDVVPDEDSDVTAPTTQVPAATIAVVDGDETAEAFEVFSFDINDAGTSDGVNTEVSQIVLFYGPNTSIVFANEIDSGYFEVDGNPIDLGGDPFFGMDSVVFPIAPGEISVPDGGSVNVVLKVILKPNVEDSKVIQLMIDADQHGFETTGISSDFAAAFAGDIIGNNITIDVVATELNFSVEPTDVYVDATIDPAVVIEAIDANGNIDTDYTTNVSITATTATLVGTPVVGTPVAGVVTFDALSFSDEGTGVTLTAASGILTNVTSATFDVTIEPEKDLFFSEYIEGGSGSNKAFEIYNPTNATIDLSDYTVKHSRGGAGWGQYDESGEDTRYILPLSGTIEAGDVYVITHAEADIAEIIAASDLALTYNSTVNGSIGTNVVSFTGDDALGLFKNDVLIDVIGIPTEDPGTAWDVADTTEATANHTMIRKFGTLIGNVDWASSAGTNNDNSEWIVYADGFVANIGSPSYDPSAAEIVSFVMDEEKEAATINSGAGTIDITVVNGTTVTALVPTITISGFATISPESGVAQDFSSPVDYTVTAEDGTEKVWTVTVTVSATLSDKAEILTFEIPNMDDVNINISDTSILVNMPYGTNAAALTPTFTISAGATVDIASGTEQNFSSPFIYTVTAQNSTNIMEWEVTVEVFEATELTIHDIQYTTDASGDSPYKGELVKTSGIVTATNTSGFFIQDGDGAWNGIYVYNNTVTRTVGDEVEFVSTVDEYNKLTELKNVLDFAVLSQGNILPTVAEITTVEGNDEQYESVLVYLNDVLCTDPDMGYGMFEINDGSGALLVDDVLFAYAADSLAGYDMTAIGYVYGTEYKVIPRNANDVVIVSPVIGSPTLNPVTPTSAEDVTITVSITDNDNDASELTNELFYGSALGSENTEVTFAETATANEFEGTIPASASTVYYLITATDGTFDAEYAGSYSVITGIDNPDGIVSMNIFPNPSNGLFTIEMNASKAGNFNIDIINIQGQVVYSKQINQDGFYKDQIDLSNEARGIYYIRINDSNDMKVSKIMIQ